MSTWISKALIIPLLVSGCVLPDAIAGGAQSNTGAKSDLRETMQVGGLKLAGPSGFCPLEATQQSVGGAEFVAFAPCSGDAGAILAATVGGKNSAAGLTMKSEVLGPYFRTEDGLAALRGAGRQDDISVHDVADYKGTVILQLTRIVKGQATESWRALMQVDGRLVTLTVRPRQGQTVPARDGKRLITRFVDAIQGANRA